MDLRGGAGLTLAAIVLAGCGRIGFDAPGGDAAAPAVIRTCADAKRAGKVTGVTRLEAAAGARDTWCDQDRAGGGWALALKIDGAATTFAIDSALWGDTTLLAPSDLAPTGGEAKLAPYVEDEVAEVLLVVDGGGAVVIPLRGPSLRALLAAPFMIPSRAAVGTVRAAFGTTSLDAGCQRVGAALTDTNRVLRGRLGALGAAAAGDCQVPTSFVGIGVGVPCSSGTITAGNVAGSSGDRGAACTPARVEVYVRGDDRTHRGAAASCVAHRDAGATEDGVYLVGSPAVRRRCEMTSDGGGWTEALTLDSLAGACPAGWMATPTHPLCEVPTGITEARTLVASPIGSYAAVMASVIAFQRGSVDAFTDAAGIEGPYVDGLGITAGVPRRHVLTFAAGYGEVVGCATPGSCQCPCAGGTAPPGYVGAAYRCEAGAYDQPLSEPSPDPMFDGVEVGAGCGGEASPTPLSVAVPATTDDLEVRLMRNEPNQDEGMLVYRLDLWVR